MKRNNVYYLYRDLENEEEFPELKRSQVISSPLPELNTVHSNQNEEK